MAQAFGAEYAAIVVATTGDSRLLSDLCHRSLRIRGNCFMSISVQEMVDKPRVKALPDGTGIPVPFIYAPSSDGTDENLLILLHGLGDTHIPFAKLAKQLRLPQTATLALRAPEKIPFLLEEAFQWYTSFDGLGDVLTRPDPTPALEFLTKTLQHLTSKCGWPSERIHLFGFAQGGSVASELALHWWQATGHAARLGSVITVTGPLLSYPTPSQPCPTPVLVFDRLGAASRSELDAGVAAFRKGFATVVAERFAGEGMPRSRDEMERLMRFWADRLGQRVPDGAMEVRGTA